MRFPSFGYWSLVLIAAGCGSSPPPAAEGDRVISVHVTRVANADAGDSLPAPLTSEAISDSLAKRLEQSPLIRLDTVAPKGSQTMELRLAAGLRGGRLRLRAELWSRNSSVPTWTATFWHDPRELSLALDAVAGDTAGELFRIIGRGALDASGGTR